MMTGSAASGRAISTSWLEESHRGAAFWSRAEEEAHEHVLVALVQLHAVVIDAGRAHHFVQFREVTPHRLAIIARDERGIGQHRVAAFHIEEARGPVEIEIEFLLIEQMKRGHVVLAEAQVLEGGFQLRRRHEEIGEDDRPARAGGCSPRPRAARRAASCRRPG